MRKPIAQRIKELEERKRALQSRLGKQERAQETRRKILLGSFVLESLAKDDDTSDPFDLRDWLQRDLPTFLDREADRALFADLIVDCRMDQGRGLEDGTAQQRNGCDQHADSRHADVIGGDEP
ncbi:mobilization protein [Agrobacterium rosae]|uniref:mobilization protein n=1 Tax=Agrobacterium rosae TaxID=1972867 RepID=UPI002A15B7D0|nr:mobilization protein [Agrobacterium rosae]MDX8316904.1 mobilization protein [Agrobacterium rosae]MDX8316923.1 mobilization protein [Agrobacterium rosae]